MYADAYMLVYFYNSSSTRHAKGQRSMQDTKVSPPGRFASLWLRRLHQAFLTSVFLDSLQNEDASERQAPHSNVPPNFGVLSSTFFVSRVKFLAILHSSAFHSSVLYRVEWSTTFYDSMILCVFFYFSQTCVCEHWLKKTFLIRQYTWLCHSCSPCMQRWCNFADFPFLYHLTKSYFSQLWKVP